MKKAVALGIMWLLVTVAALAQVSPPVVQDGTYRLQQEDVIEIQVLDQQQIRAQVTVGKDGNITAPFVGVVRAEGKTTSELEADLVQEYIRKVRLRDPRVSVVIVRFREILVTVGGAVQRAGKQPVRPTDTVLSVVQNAQPITANNTADLRKATLQKAGSRELIPLDLHAMLIKGDMSQNYPVTDGDIINIPENTKNRVQVLGAVQRPQTLTYTDPMTLSDAITACGGDIPYRTKFSEVYVIRERPGMPGSYVRIRANYVNFLTKGDASQNVTLQPGDLVYVSQTKTPDGGRIGEVATSIANVFFILDRIGIRFLGGP